MPRLVQPILGPIERVARITDALQDDLNAPLALTELHGLARRIMLYEGSVEHATNQAALRIGGGLMGLLGSEPDAFLKGVQRSDLELIRMRIADRAAARRAREFAKADEIRAELADLGVILEDKPDGTTDWRRG